MGKALVVYESMWGNTEKVARAVAEGLASALQVEVYEVTDAPGSPTQDVDLIVVGGPTHAFSMTRASTRQDARSQGADHGGETGLREWLDGLPSGEPAQHVATFDTRVEKMRHLPGSAAKSAARVVHRTATSGPTPARASTSPASTAARRRRAGAGLRLGPPDRRRRPGSRARAPLGQHDHQRQTDEPVHDGGPASTIRRHRTPAHDHTGHSRSRRRRRRPPRARRPVRAVAPGPGPGPGRRPRPPRTAPAARAPWSPADLSDQARPTNTTTPTTARSQSTLATIMRSPRSDPAARIRPWWWCSAAPAGPTGSPRRSAALGRDRGRR